MAIAAREIERADELAAELDRYRGKWVAIKDAKVFASGDSPAEVYEATRELSPDEWVLDRVPEDPNSIFIL